MARLKNVEIYAINWLNSKNISPEEIAQELKIKVDQVVKVLEKNGVSKKTETEDSIKTASGPAVSKSKNLMITKTSAKNNNTVAIMTKEASEYNDSIRHKSENPRTKNSIFKTNE
jgi:hypothetical protein